MKTTRTLILIATFLMPIWMVAQSNYTEGYIITNESDTVRGLIDFTTDKNITNECKFKKTKDSDQLTYKPGEIKGFSILDGGKQYISREVELEEEKRTVFLEYLVDGIMNLYYYRDNKTVLEYYYFEGEDGKMISVTKKPDNKINETTAVADNKYKGIISYMFKEHPTILPDTKKLSFKRETMINIVKNYHNEVCTTGEDCIVFENNFKTSHMTILFSFYGGVQLLDFETHKSIKIGEEDGYDIYGETEESSKSTSPMIGAQMDIFNYRWSKVISLQADLNISSYNVKSQFNGSENYWYKLKGMMAGIHLGPKYTYHKGKVRPVLGAGIGANIPFANKIDDNSLLRNDPQATYSYYFETGVNYQLGVKNAVIVRALYEKASQAYQKNTNIQFKVGYTF